VPLTPRGLRPGTTARSGHDAHASEDGGRPGAAVPAWLRSAFDEIVVNADPLPWGFRNETWRAELSDGRQYAATRLFEPAAAGTITARVAAVRLRLAGTGLPIPPVAESGTQGGHGILISPFQEGISGAAILGQSGGGEVVGSLLGGAWRSIAHADPVGLDVPDLWSSGHRLATAAAVWLKRLGDAVPRSGRTQLEGAIEALPEVVGSATAGIVHGDLVPANILVLDNALVALLDLEFVRLGDPRLDAAWFDWIVWFHHRPIHGAAWEAFSAAARMEPGDPATRRAVRVLPAVRLLEILDGLEGRDPHRGHWIEHLGAWATRR
jgi:phosphotransferase family enzyme